MGWKGPLMWSMSLLKVGIVGSGGLQSCSVKFSISARVESTRPLGNLLLYLTAETVKDIDMLVPVLYLKVLSTGGKILLLTCWLLSCIESPIYSWAAFLKDTLLTQVQLLSIRIPKFFLAELPSNQSVLLHGSTPPHVHDICLS